MDCETVNSSLVSGRLLSDAEEVHLTTCGSCAKLVATIRTWQPVAVGGTAPRVPGIATLERRARVQNLRVAGLAIAATALLAATQFHPHTVVDDLGHDVLAANDTASEATEPADVALVALVAGFDRLDATPAALQDAALVDLLDPFGDDPVADPLNTRSTEGDL